MSEKNDQDLKFTQELYDFLQGNQPQGYKVKRSTMPKLSPDQAWTVIWYLGNQYWQVTDRVERCEVCGELFHTWQSGTCLDFGKAPYHFCDSCMMSDEYEKKKSSKLNPENEASERKAGK